MTISSAKPASGLRASLLALASAAALITAAGSAVAEGVAPIADRPEPVANEAGTKAKIAIIGFSNNPYWIAVQKGAETANDVLKSRGGEVRWIVGGANIDVPTVNQAINAAATQGYNGIGFFIAGEGNCALIKNLIAEKKISIGAYNTLFPCVEEAGGVINYAQDQFAAGKNAAAELVKAVGDKEGKVGVIVSQFTAPGSEQRRKGFVEGLAGSKLSVVNDGIEAKDSAGSTFSAAKDFLTSTPDLVAIYATAGGPFGAAQAVKTAGKQDSVKVIGYDFTKENVAAIHDGSMFGVTGQDEFGQGYNVAIALFNDIVAQQKPEKVLQPAVSLFMTKDNVDQLDPEKLPVGAVPKL
ncbi:ABC transporter substrate-binding protein [Kaistia sp. 32K]|uniref:sugar ABC transporter substrate-binding protein n=1 Tax=Kaistia sp. 32K TaxID=2795690 RepID=UPI0019165E49|nr:sugar ABC transporter substrate-binding protein [Kaistia sp. 32K]BCP55524.1 ABC transporter substrate-binding protein [Kaistia sp. 32K]